MRKQWKREQQALRDNMERSQMGEGLAPPSPLVKSNDLVQVFVQKRHVCMHSLTLISHYLSTRNCDQ
jgi:hypothetical protein